MNEVEYEGMEEQSHAGSALMAELNEYFGEEGADAKRLSRCLYKATDCGAWLSVDGEGLRLGSIVEGSDVDCETHTLDWVSYLRMDEGDLSKWLDSTIEEIESEATQLWREANEYLTCPGCDYQFIDTGEAGVCDNCGRVMEED